MSDIVNIVLSFVDIIFKRYIEFIKNCNKPSIAAVRNISGLDKRRIIKNQLCNDKKFVPDEYLDAISDKIIMSIAIKPNNVKSEEKVV